ncbi:MAG: inositol monophosphatase family protein, partial [Actinomycetota bacterium]
TVNFLYGIPWWCVSIAARDQEGSIVGAIHNPILGETFTAVRGEGAWLNGQTISVSDRDDFSKALVATGFAYDARAREVQGRAAFRVLPAGRDLRRMGSAALDLCSVACGRVDAFFEAHLEEWDKAAGRLIAAEAGAVVTQLTPPLETMTPGLAVSNPKIHDELLRLIGEGE